MNTNWINNPKFNELPWEKRTFIQNFLLQNQYRSAEEMLPILLKLNSSLKDKNLSFSPQEQKILSEIVMDSLSTKEQTTWRALQTLLKNK